MGVNGSSEFLPKMKPNPRVIRSKEFVEHVRSGMTDLEMSEKYGLTVRDFDRVMEYLADAGLITKGELLERRHLSDSQIIRAFIESRENSRVID
jgi:transcription initiation factor IIE alpha subunit